MPTPMPTPTATEIADRPVQPPPRGAVAAFVAIFLMLYAAAVGIAEMEVARSGQDTAFQKLLALRGQQAGWVVLGASHALPLAFGDIAGRVRADGGPSVAVLAEAGAGPVYNELVFRQALEDVAPRRLLYVVDSFAFTGPTWNEARLSDRKLLRKTPLRLSTARNMALVVARHRAGAGGLADYLTGFSKLNPPERFPQGGWRGAADFDRKVRLSRHAVRARIKYLYPRPPQPDTVARYLDVLTGIFDAARAAGIEVVVVKLPMPDAFRAALPDEAVFDRALQQRLSERAIPYHDLSAALPEPAYYFDTDHLNRAGVEALYDAHLRDILIPEPGS